MNARAPLPDCYHCGLPAPHGNGLEVAIGGEPRPMCCPGCSAVAQAIVASGCADYYRDRSAYAATAQEAALVPAQLAQLDRASAACEPGTGAGAASDVLFSVDGLRCAACSWLIERQLARLPGVAASAMNLSTGRLRVRLDGACKPSQVVRALHAIGYSAYPHDPDRRAAALEAERKSLFRRLFIAALAMMQVMMYALPEYVAEAGALDPDMAALMRWASLVLSAPAVLYCALPFYRGAWRALRAGMPGMDLPVAIGILAASAASVLATVRGTGPVYFDSVTMFVFLLLAGRYLELAARRRAARALERLRHGLPGKATRIDGAGASEIVAAAALVAGDVISVAPGEALAADALVLRGASEIDVALLSGESRAQPCGPGDELPGGAVNLSQPLLVRVLRQAGESTLAQLVRLAEGAGEGKPHIGAWADRVAAWFVLALLALTVLVFAAWQVRDPARAWEVAIAVLVVSCPCALSLATPSALAAATSSLVRRGVLVVQPHVLETLHRATHVVFDKTGTLTLGRPVLQHVQVLGAIGRARCMALAAALEAGSAHPLAAAIRAGAPAACAPPDGASAAGQGVSGTIDGVRYFLGRAGFACAQPACAPAGANLTSVYLGDGVRALARFDLADGLRPDAAALVAALRRRGQQIVLLSGDGQAVADEVAGQLGIGVAIGAQLPQQKLDYVRRLQAGGAVVAMVGDGINDAAVLRAADVSFAMGGGAALAQLSADCVLVSGRLQALGDCSRIAARTLAVVRQNLAWASIYNTVAIPLAACGLITPWVSALGMSASSALVVCNALRLLRDRGD